MSIKAFKNVSMHYCPGCGHSQVHKMVCDVIDELGIRERTVGVAPVGCAVIAYDYWNFDVSEAAHGRAPAVATGLKRAMPDRIVFTYQGDGDLAAIGTGEIMHAASRGENLTVIFVNNGVYGMTGGQMAPTTLAGQKTATSLKGRDLKRDGYPLMVSEIIATMPGVKYVERVSIHNRIEIEKTKQAIKKAFQCQIEGKGFSLVEVVTVCPTYGAKNVKEAYTRLENEVLKFYKTGVIKDETV